MTKDERGPVGALGRKLTWYSTQPPDSCTGSKPLGKLPATQNSESIPVVSEIHCGRIELSNPRVQRGYIYHETHFFSFYSEAKDPSRIGQRGFLSIHSFCSVVAQACSFVHPLTPHFPKWNHPVLLHSQGPIRVGLTVEKSNP